MAKMTKSQKKRALKSIQKKCANLYLEGAMSLKDCAAVEAITARNLKKLG